MTWLKMVVFNLAKHPKRAGLILLAILVSVCVMELVGGMLEGIRQNFFVNLLADGGHGQVLGKNHAEQLDEWSNTVVVADYRPLLDRLRAESAVVRAEPIMRFRGLYVHDGHSLALRLFGVEADSRFFGKVRDSVAIDKFLTSEQSLLMSRSLAAYLKLEPGDSLRLLAEDSRGRPRLQTFSLEALFETGSRDFDDNTLLVGLAAAQSLLRLPDSVSELRFVLGNRDDADRFVAGQASWFEERQSEIKSWRQLNAGLLSIIDMMDVMILFFNLLIITVSATVITNAILMNVFDRLPEYGTLRALGFKKRHITAMILSEGSILGLLGSLLGLAAGIPLVLYLQTNGPDWGAIGEAFGMSSFFNFYYLPSRSAVSALAGWLTALLGSLYAAASAGKLAITESFKNA